ncbi:cation channel sperm-associated protein 2 isoform X5 [Lepisosteus oculatus]|uniref:cation channel sperm-associated protein 2 isoform X5 n=1 Tax=Lepisosteus oculatus TaxID=7918 RepID=UPI0007401872|nr:PREDICTED: cation channel sperm-associated protein 2 isoform X5 [Lepisosteus oculatus]
MGTQEPALVHSLPEQKSRPAQEKVLPRAEIVRAKLIQSFYLLDHLQGEVRGTPKYSTKDVQDNTVFNMLMVKESHQLVRFEVSPLRNDIITEEHRRRSRLKNRCARYPPLNMWAHWVLESDMFSNAVLFLIILNTIVLGIQAEVFDNMDPKMEILKLILDMLDWSILTIFLLEILLKWIDDFFRFWKSTWNIFDFVVTTLAMTFIFLLLLVFAYIFAVAGVIFFQSYTRSDRPDLVYNQNFKDIPSTFITLFILFTMDHWYALLQDTRKVEELDQATSGLYIILWLLIGSFIFRNIFVGIMVNNFQVIRNDLSREVQQIEIQQKADLFKAQIINRRMSQSRGTDGYNISIAKELPVEGSKEQLNSGLIYKEGRVTEQNMVAEKDWETYVEENIAVMREQEEDEKVTWPRALLFRYFELLEQLQHNLDERKRLQNVAGKVQDLEPGSSPYPHPQTTEM